MLTEIEKKGLISYSYTQEQLNALKIKEESAITQLAQQSSKVTCHFIYQDDCVEVVTYNISHGKTFLMCREKYLSPDKLDDLLVLTTQQILALERIYDTMKTQTSTTLYTYTLVWAKKGTTKQFTSHFNGKDLLDIMDKFYYHKKPADYLIYSCIMQPES